MKRTPANPPWRAVAVSLTLVAAALPAMAQYKVVQPDGSVTYTDRPPNTGTARVTALTRSGAPAAAESGLPLELRQAAARHPVTLYASDDCAPCDAGRKFLQQRGIPYAERRITGDEDTAVLERLTGGRTVPALTIGAQPLRGFSETDWSAYLEVAGYPRTSKLPRGWPAPEVRPLTERAAVAPPPASAPARAPATAEPPQPSSGLRF